MANTDIAKHVSKCLQTAILFEVSANKPGNVNLVVGFEGTNVEHFFASAVAAAPAFEESARRGVEVAEGKREISQIGVGELIKQCVADINEWQKGGNTLLGTVMLFVPLAAAAGMSQLQSGKFNLAEVRKNIKVVVESTTAHDAVQLYDAIAIANPSGLNDAPDLSVTDSKSKQRLIEENVTLFKVFQIAEGYDDICYEWVHGFPIAFDLGYPYILEQLKKMQLNTSIVNTFLKILSERPDTFISRKVGLEKARQVSADAKKVLQLGTQTAEGKTALMEFDKKLRRWGNDYNPGTTADITAETLALVILSGCRF